MASAFKKLVHDAGTTFNLDLYYTKPNGEKNLVGDTIKFILSEPGLKTPAYTYTFPGTSTGHIAIVIPDETADLWELGKYAYRLDIEFADGTKKRILRGSLDINSGVDG